MSKDFSTIFNRLCHMVVLSKDEQLDAVIDDLMLTVAVTSDEDRIESENDIADAIDIYFGIRLNSRLVASSFSRLVQSGRLIHGTDGVIAVEPHIHAEIATRIDEGYKLEEQVKNEWLSDLENASDNWPASWKNDFWNALQSYMAWAFRQHGAETISLLNPTNAATQFQNGRLSDYLLKAVDQECNPSVKDEAIQAVKGFFAASTPARTRYVAQLLDGTFAFFALNTDERTIDYLCGELSSLKLFLDTNFLYSILDLRSNPLDDSSRELIDVIEEYGFPFSLYFHQITLKELEDTIQYQGSRLRSRPWPQALSKAVIRTTSDEINGLEFAYHKRNAETPVSPDVFLLRFESLFDLLKNEYGFSFYNSTQESKPQKDERYQLCATYKEFLEEVRPKPKAYSAINHDMKLLQTVDYLRYDGSSILNAGALLVTFDYYLWRFDWRKLRDTNKLGLTILPNHLLQLLRPFTVHTSDFDRRFIETFAIPEFRTLTKFTSVTPKVIEYLSAFPDIKEETAVRLLANKVMKQQLEDAVDHEEQFAAIIESTLLEDNERLVRENEHAARIAHEAGKQSIEKEEDIRKLKKKRHEEQLKFKGEIEQLAEKTEQQISKDAERIYQLEQALERETRERDREKREHQARKAHQRQARKKWLKWTAGVAIFLMGMMIAFVAPQYIHWNWFDSHPNQLGLRVLTVIFFSIVSAIVILWPKHRVLLVFSGIGTAGYTLAQIIDPKF